MEPGKRRKIISYSIDAVLGLVIVFLLSTMVQMLITRNGNYGVPRAYGLSFLYVGTNSMEGDKPDSLPQGTGIVIKQAEAKNLKIGDVVTFYDKNLGAPNTHRLVEEPVLDGTIYRLHTKGDNTSAATASYDGEYFTSNELIGVVIGHNDGFGAFLSFVSPSASTMAVATGRPGASIWFFPLACLAPLAGIAAVSVVSTVIEARKLKKEEQEELRKAMVEAGIDMSDEAAVLSFTEKWRAKREIREELEREREKEKKRLRRQMKRRNQSQ